MQDIDQMNEQQKQPPARISLGLRCFLLLILVLSVVIFASRMLTYHQLTEEKKDLENKKDLYQAQIDKMNHYLDGSIDYEDIIRIARDKYNLVFPDDTIIYSGQGVQP
jgi:cell division protein FtsB